MSAPFDWLQRLGVFALVGVGLFLLKRWYGKRSDEVDAFLDKQEWFRIVAMPAQIPDVIAVAEKHSWRLADTMMWKDGTNLYKFEKANKSALSFSELNKILGDPALPKSAESQACKFQIKIAELSDYESFNAQTH
ncbi:MAG: hypothetical protein IPG54_01125 [Sphingomonadales bacterium]|jgi:hypothetical protein|nr:hypothetical protein [Sphingomonadales bacterium]MBK9003695.1 hypothetical protein [Sphingomonadales bacterium]MBK9268869.1 hypothetical protein [Sphingomonadales bacterium]MBP6434788.1 hypothetical protein [Sphingorhabdus sp.]